MVKGWRLDPLWVGYYRALKLERELRRNQVLVYEALGRATRMKVELEELWEPSYPGEVRMVN